MLRASDVNVVAAADNVCELRAAVSVDGHRRAFRLWYRLPAAAGPFVCERAGDALLAAVLVPAMRLGESVRIDAPVSARLLRACDSLQGIYRTWDRTLAKVDIDALASA